MGIEREDIKEIAGELFREMQKFQTPTITVREFSTVYLEKHAKPHIKDWKGEESRLRLYILPALGDLQLSLVSTADVLSFQSFVCEKARLSSKALSDGKYVANRCIQQLGLMFRLARDWGYFPEDKRVPTDRVRCFTERARERFVDESEMERLAKAIDRRRKTAPHLRALFWLCLMTCLRRDELRTARWDDLDLDNKQLRRAGKFTKGGKPICQPLSDEACQLLNELPRSSPYIFSAKGKDRPVDVSTVYNCWDRIRTEANLSDVRIHDLRRTGGSWLAQSGVPLLLINKALNHSDITSTQIYARFSNADVRQVLQQHSAKLAPYVCGIEVRDASARLAIPVEPEIPVIPETVPETNTPSLAKSINQCAPHLSVFFWLYFMTGLTKNQLLSAKWQDLDETSCALKVMNNYKKQEKKHYLASQAMTLLSSLPRHSVYIFAPARKPRHVTVATVKGAWLSVCRRAHLPGFEVQTLQRTAMKLAKADGLPSGLIAVALNRTTLASNRGAVRSNYTEAQVREAVELIATKITSLAEHNSVERI